MIEKRGFNSGALGRDERLGREDLEARQRGAILRAGATAGLLVGVADALAGNGAMDKLSRMEWR